MMRRSIAVMLFAALQGAGHAATPAGNATVSLRIEGREIALAAETSARLAALAREVMERCGPNTRQHPHNFGASALLASLRRDRTLEGSRLHVAYDRPFESVSHLGGVMPVSEVTLGLGEPDLFVGPGFSRHGGEAAEHLLCGYLPSLEIACLPEVAARLPARYRDTCARFTREASGRIVMPPPDIAPSCS
jgi:hypothetical protein